MLFTINDQLTPAKIDVDNIYKNLQGSEKWIQKNLFSIFSFGLTLQLVILKSYTPIVGSKQEANALQIDLWLEKSVSIRLNPLKLFQSRVQINTIVNHSFAFQNKLCSKSS